MLKPEYRVILFYQFSYIEDTEAFCTEHRILAEQLGLKGRLLIASEGINGTFEGTVDALESYKKSLTCDTRFKDIGFKESAGTGKAFRKLEIRVRDEVVTLNAGTFDIPNETAPVITAADLENLYAQNEDFVVLDLRNDYEIQAGKFERTIDPGLKNFRDLPSKLPELAPLKKKKVITVCTGGIRCEKATCLLRKEGFENVYQLKDGIHTYMQEFPGKRFKGTLFVFDNRMVTPVVDSPQREIIGTCFECGITCEAFYSDDSVRPSRKVICCSECLEKHAELRSCA